jgi:signal transduction histidine kinase
MQVADLRSIALFDGLSDDQLAQLLAAGTEVQIEPGVELFHEGDPADFWYVLVDGSIELFRHVGREDMLVGKMDMPGRWSGGFRAWDEHGVCLATGLGATGGRALRVPSDKLRELFNAWFPFGVHLVAGLYGTARAIEATARQRQSLVKLGTLAAGLAHELNNPAAAAIRNVAALEASVATLLSSLGRLSDEQITAAQFSVLDDLRREIGDVAAFTDALSLSDQEEALASWLTERQVEQAWEVAPALAAAGADVEWCERVETALGSAALEPALQWVASALSMTGLLAQLKDSTRRVSELVAATRAYTQMDRGSLQTIDVTEGLESTLTMLSHKLRDGVAVVRRYAEDLPRIEAFPGELNQVWTNLIDNAVDAMSGRGTLTVAARPDDGAVLIEIGDTGAGMSPEVASRAFEPFYTTKDVGAGTGLGLDIAQRIVVERHGGTITIDSHPGETVLRVRLPIRKPGS